MSKMNENAHENKLILADTKSYDEEKMYIMTVFILALSIRIVVIVLIYLLDGFFEPYMYVDDKKYETFAKAYAETATKLIDTEAFKMGEYSIGGRVIVAKLYFWFNSVLYYLTKKTVCLRLSNILFSSLTVIPIFLLTKELFGSEEAKIASNLFACLPYHAIMSAFVFKDILIVLLMSSSLYMIIKYYKYGKINIPLFLLLTIPIEWLRFGIPLFLFGVLILAILIRHYNSFNIPTIYLCIIVIIITILIMGNVLKDDINLLISRFEGYLQLGREYSTNIKLIRIDSLAQLYKLPLTWFFSTFFPMSFTLQLNSWSDILQVFNYTLLIVAAGYIFFAIFHKKTWVQRIFFYPMLILHLLVITLVINIPRHYYFLHFYMIICSSAHLATLEGKKIWGYTAIVLLMASTLLLATMLII